MNNNNNNVYLYTAHITWSHGGLQFCKGEIGCRHIEGASGCRFSPYVISPYPQRPDHNTRDHIPYELSYSQLLLEASLFYKHIPMNETSLHANKILS